MNNKTRYLAQAGLVAAVYAVSTMLLAPISYGPVQIRVSEALTILPAIFPGAIPGLFIGCAISNLLSGYGILDIVFGSLATLVAAFLTSRLSNKWLVPLPPVIINAVVVGALISYVAALPFVPTMLSVGFGQLIACYAIGVPLYVFLKKHEERFKI